ncbi:MAG: double zinc ribbon domain-containing protein [Aquabacterium sp.]
MSLKNFHDRSVSSNDAGAGFQFEFYCESCSSTWKSPFKPYRPGQISAMLQRAALLGGDVASAFNKFGKVFSDMYRIGRAGSSVSGHAGSKAYQTALQDAMAEAARRYHKCGSCKKTVCDECWNEDEQTCTTCLRERSQNARTGYGSQGGTMVCANCQVPSQGGRFCHECGFDMASTHKSCPGCGTTMPRAARFCTDCGHGF